MNEIERAIKYVTTAQENANKEGRTEDVYNLMVVKQLLRAELSRQENAPLTWDELSAMIGKPVYIADLVDASESNWAIIGKAYSKLGLEFITLYDTIEGDVGCQELYGETWIAYRYEPKGEPPCLK